MRRRLLSVQEDGVAVAGQMEMMRVSLESLGRGLSRDIRCGWVQWLRYETCFCFFCSKIELKVFSSPTKQTPERASSECERESERVCEGYGQPRLGCSTSFIVLPLG